jgi:hypothetical protein
VIAVFAVLVVTNLMRDTGPQGVLAPFAGGAR